jgi:hypothetical protein
MSVCEGGIPVIAREKAVKRYPDGVFIVDSMVYDREIRKELEQLGAKTILDFGAYLREIVR